MNNQSGRDVSGSVAKAAGRGISPRAGQARDVGTRGQLGNDGPFRVAWASTLARVRRRHEDAGKGACPRHPSPGFSDRSLRVANRGECGRDGRATVAAVAEPLEGRRLLSAGDPDPSFGAGGVATVPSLEAYRLYGMKVALANGKTVVAGNDDGDGIFVARFDAAGKPDPSFGGGDGLLRTSFGASPDLNTGGLVALAVRPADNKIYLLTGDEQVLRLNADGSVDFAFGGRGDGVADLALTYVTGMALAPGGKVVAIGYGPNFDGADPQVGVERLTDAGRPDKTFSGDGVFEGFAGFPQATVVQPDGKVLVAGVTDYTGAPGQQAAVGRLTAAGAPDPSFGGGDGLATLDLGGTYADAGAISLDPAGRAIVTTANGETGARPYRLKADGSVDKVFAPLDVPGAGSPTAVAVAVAVAADGKLLVAGGGGSDDFGGDVAEGFVARYTAAGTIDTTYGGGLGVQHSAGYAPGIAADGRVVMAGAGFGTGPTGLDGLQVVRHLAVDSGPDRSGISLASNGTLTVRGTAGDDDVDLVDLSEQDGPAVLRVRSNGFQRAFAKSAVKQIVIRAGDGNDTALVRTLNWKVPAALYGEGGNDVLWGGAGDDLLDGGTGNDGLKGDTWDSADPAGAHTGDDHLIGGAGDDGLFDAAGVNTLEGGDGNDELRIFSAAGDPASRLLGGNGNDTLTGGDGDDALDGGAGNDSLAGGRGADALAGGPGDDSLDAGDGNDKLLGGAGNDTLLGGAGDDRLDGGTGADRLFGGDGADTADYGSRTRGVTVDLGDTFLGRDGEPGEGDTVYGDVEIVVGGSGNDTLRGSEAANILFGNAGDDLLDGRGGNDQLTGGPGKDRLYGGAGDDRLYARDGAFADYVDGGPGTDKAQRDDKDAIFAIEEFI